MCVCVCERERERLGRAENEHTAYVLSGYRYSHRYKSQMTTKEMVRKGLSGPHPACAVTDLTIDRRGCKVTDTNIIVNKGVNTIT